METLYTNEFMWRNGVLLQKVLTLKGGTDLEHQWEGVKVGERLVKDPTFKTFEDRNGKEPMAKREGWDHVIEFDGGTNCNTPPNFGEGYGSYQIDGGEIKRVKFGKGHSNNSAEIRTLIEGLRELKKTDPSGTVLCRGDSQIALKWISCRNKPSPKGSEKFLEAVAILQWEVASFRKVKGEWRRRNFSVALFNH